jgi:hypothetical protein
MVFVRRNESYRRQYVKAARAGLIVLGLVTATSSHAQPVATAHNKNSEQITKIPNL